MDTIEIQVPTKAVLSNNAQLTVIGRPGPIGRIQTLARSLVAREQELGLEHARAVTHRRAMAVKRVEERAQKVA